MTSRSPSRWQWLVLAATAAFAAGCGRPPVTLHDPAPDSLSAWGLLVTDGQAVKLNDRVLAYELNTPLFSDYARKLRTVWMPEGEAAIYRENGDWEFPVGTVFTKTFYYPVAGPESVAASGPAGSPGEQSLDLAGVRLIETRLLVKRAGGWEAYPYVWNSGQTDARLKRVGDLRALNLVRDDGRAQPFTYVVPDANQCAGCHRPDHTSRELRPIGPKTLHLNLDEQLADWTEAGYLRGAPAAGRAPAIARWDDATGADVASRARAYLDVNCGHCHNPRGAADTSGLFLDIATTDARRLGRCKPPIAAGKGSGGRQHSIVPGDPDGSILVYRMETGDPAAAMPELGRAVVHEEGVALIREWIAGMSGECRTGSAGQGDEETL